VTGREGFDKKELDMVLALINGEADQIFCE
jgi:hypothetical protein